MVVENSVRLGEIEVSGGDPQEHSSIMRESMMALAAPDLNAVASIHDGSNTCRCSNTFPATTSGICRSSSRSRAARRSARSTRCAARCAMRRGKGTDVGTGDFLKEWIRMADKLVELAGGGQGEAATVLRGHEAAARRALLPDGRAHAGARSPGANGNVPQGQRGVSRSDGAWPRELRARRDSVREQFHSRSARARAGCRRARAARALRQRSRQLQGAAVLVGAAGRTRTPRHFVAVDRPAGDRRDAAHRRAAGDATPRSNGRARCSTGSRRVRDVDATRIGMAGISLGGHFVGRAVAKEPRFACGAVWGANHNWAEVQQKRLKREGENPVPHYWNHVMWVFGAKDMDDFFAKTAGMHLNGVMQEIRVPFLVTHGARDRQISVDYAHQSYDQLVNSPDRELKIFTDREGGVEHVGADNMSFGRDYIADWFAEHLGGRTA